MSPGHILPSGAAPKQAPDTYCYSIAPLKHQVLQTPSEFAPFFIKTELLSCYVSLPNWNHINLYLQTSTALMSCSPQAARPVTLANICLNSPLHWINTISYRQANLGFRNSQ